MSLQAAEKRLLSILESYPHALKILATRVRALEMALYDNERNLYHRYLTRLAYVESQKHSPSGALASSELDQLIALLSEVTKEPKRKKPKK